MISFDLLHSPYPSRRSPVVARRGAVSTSHPLAAQAGLRMLMEGGNAIDAAVATAAALAVVQPPSNGIGGDAFALVWDGDKLHGLNASGRAPRALTPEVFARQGLSEVPQDGWLAVTVPGAVSGWVALLERFGTMPLEHVLGPAIEYAEQGYPVQPIVSYLWKNAEERFGSSPEFADFQRVFFPGGRAPRAGEMFRMPQLGRSLRLIGESRGEAFYRGELAEAMAAYAARTGGYLTVEDLAAHEPEWVEPISTEYRGYRLWEIPPNGQGIVALMTLNILEGVDVPGMGHRSAEELHWTVEALKLAFADAYRYVADPGRVPVPVAGMLDKTYAASRRELLRADRALENPSPGLFEEGDTVYLCTADAEGRMVSFIQSTFLGFGSGVVDPETGVHFQNRGHGFTLAEGHPNRLEPGKRPFHTIIPGFITKDGVPLAAFGVMGGDMQAQGHVQVFTAMVDHGLQPQAALDAPRVRVRSDGEVCVEPGVPVETVRRLAAWGHRVRIDHDIAGFGGGKMIWRDPDSGVLIVGTEPRQDGAAVGL